LNQPCLQTKDSGSLTLEKAITLIVSNLNEAPTALNLSSTSFSENIAAGSAIATLSSTDPDSGDTFTYALAAGSGDPDNAYFTINGNELEINASADFESQNSYNIRLQTKDSGDLILEKTFTLIVTDQDEVPPTIALTSSKSSLTTGEQAALTFTLSEDSNDFTAGDVKISVGGTLSNFQGSSQTYTATFTPKSNSTTLSVISVGNNAFSDIAGNFNVDGIESNNKILLLVDTTVAPGVKVALPADLSTDENGKTAEISLSLKTQPSAPVRLNFALSKGAEGTLNQEHVEFSISDWKIAQVLTITGMEDYVDDGDQPYSLTITATSEDPKYQTSTDLKGLQIPTISLINKDDGEDIGADIRGDSNGQPTNDELNGTEGADRIHGLLLDDILSGSTGDDQIFGGYGRDVLYGGQGNDALYGGAGNDQFTGGEGNDTISGGDGVDEAIYASSQDAYITTYDSETSKVTIWNISAGLNDIDTLTGIELFRFADASLTLSKLFGNSASSSSQSLDLNEYKAVNQYDSMLLMRHLLGTFPGDSIRQSVPGTFDLSDMRTKLSHTSESSSSQTGGLNLDLDGDNQISSFSDGLAIMHYVHLQTPQTEANAPWMPPAAITPSLPVADLQQHLHDLVGF
jgi:Ca2+-binding RTX toxin-like protein